MILLSVAACLLALWAYFRHRRMTLLRRLGFPGPPPNFFIGNLYEIKTYGSVEAFSRWSKAYGDVYGFYMGGTYHLMVTDVELLRRMQIKDFSAFVAHNPVIKGGIHPTAVGEDHLAFTKDWSR